MSVSAERYANDFLFTWLRHFVPEAVATGRPRDVGLPDDWESSLVRFHLVGLSTEAMLDAIAITMHREDVADDALFRYFCGVCWRKVSETHSEQRRPTVATAAYSELPRLPRSTVRRVACPRCGAAPDDPCVGVRGKPRESNHRERVLAAAEMDD